MSMITKPRKAEPIIPSDIAQRIETLKAEIRGLDQDQYRLAAQSIDDPKIEATYQQNIASSVEKQREVERLQAALIGLDQRSKRAAAVGRVDGRRDRLEQFEAAAGQRLKAIEELASGIETATQAYSKYLAACAHMETLLPDGATLPWSSQDFEVIAGGPPLACGPALAISAEMFRAGNGAQLALPGAKAPVLQVVDRPSDIEPMADSARRQTEFLITHVRRQVEIADGKEAA